MSGDEAGAYTVAQIDKPGRGTEITLHLREGQEDLLSSWKLKSLIRKYSDHIVQPIVMKKEEWNEEQKAQVVTDEDETVNQANALWTRAKNDISEDEYKGFYKHVAHDFEDPLAWTPLARRGPPRIHQPALHPEERALRPVGPQRQARHQALREARLHHGRRREADADLPALRARRGRLGRPAAQRVARDPAGIQGHRHHPRRLHQEGADPAREPGQQRRGRGQGEVRRVLEGLRQGAEGRRGRGLRQQGQDRRPAALRLDQAGYARRGGLARRLHRPHEGRPGQDLLRHRRDLQRREEQPASRGLPQEGHRGAAAAPTASTSG